MLTTQAQVRAAFWLNIASLDWRIKHKGKTHNDCPAEVRCAFVNYVDSLAREGLISEKLADRVTL